MKRKLMTNSSSTAGGGGGGGEEEARHGMVYMMKKTEEKKKKNEEKKQKKNEAAAMLFMCAEEAYYRALQPPCNSCGKSEQVEFRYFNNRYRTKGTRISSFDQPRYRCRSPSCAAIKEFGPRNIARYDPAAAAANNELHINHNKEAQDVNPHQDDLANAAEEAIAYLLHIDQLQMQIIPPEAEECEQLQLPEVIGHQDGPYIANACYNDKLGRSSPILPLSTSTMIQIPHEQVSDGQSSNIYDDLDELLALDDLDMLPGLQELIQAEEDEEGEAPTEDIIPSFVEQVEALGFTDVGSSDCWANFFS